MSFYHIVFCGTDGIGKTTQIQLFEKYFQSLDFKTLLTRAIGGPKGSEIELLREFLFKTHLKDNRIEESVFSITEDANLRWVEEQKWKHLLSSAYEKDVIVLQDRGMVTHYSYATAKGIEYHEILNTYRNSINKFRELKTINIVLMPESVDTIVNRIKKRNEDVNSALSIKFETVAFQTKVLDIITTLRDQPSDLNQIACGDTSFVVVKEDDTEEMVFETIRKILDAKIQTRRPCKSG